MSNYPCTPALGSFIYLAQQCQISSPVNRLRLALIQDIGTDPVRTDLQKSATFAAMLDVANTDEATFTGYTAGGKVLAPTDFTISQDLTNRKRTLNVNVQQLWNPAGGSVNNAVYCSVLCWAPTLADMNYANWIPLGLSLDAAGPASSGTYANTFGTLESQGPA